RRADRPPRPPRDRRRPPLTGFTALRNTGGFHRTSEHRRVSPHFGTPAGFTALRNTGGFHRTVEQEAVRSHSLPLPPLPTRDLTRSGARVSAAAAPARRRARPARSSATAPRRWRRRAHPAGRRP